MINAQAPKPAQLVLSSSSVRIYHGRAEDWEGGERVDLVFTNPYGALPRSLAGVPMILHQWVHRSDELARWAGVDEGDLLLLGKWNRGREAFWALNMAPFPLDVERFNPEPGGWYPPDLVAVILSQFWANRLRLPDLEESRKAEGRVFTVWDGFMGRGTIARECRIRDLNYIGVEELSAHIDLALEYLGMPW